MKFTIHEPEAIEIPFKDGNRLESYKNVHVNDYESGKPIQLNHDQLLLFARERISRMRDSMEYKRFIEDAIRFGDYWDPMHPSSYYKWREDLTDEQFQAYQDVRSGMFDEEIEAYHKSENSKCRQKEKDGEDEPPRTSRRREGGKR